jgi:hypothetical protein
MNKPFLLIVNHYYPEPGTYDWIECYEWESDAIAKGMELAPEDSDKSYTVVDLRTWTQ